MAYNECPNPNCEQTDNGAVYQCSNCGGYGCYVSAFGFFGGDSGCWVGAECPHCGHTDTKEYDGRIVHH
jgi:predicted nucleic acid binding AN1-type Zn finger protein